MDFSILNAIKEYIPVPVIVAVVIVIMLVYVTSFAAEVLEDYLEEKFKKQIKFFNHKKIWLSLFWCIICSVTVAAAGYISWKELPFYIFVILGGSTFLYESFIKRWITKNA